MHRIIIPSVVIAMVCLPQTLAPARTWTDATGTMQVEAELVDATAEKVWLLRDGRRIIVAQLDAFGEADRKFVAEHLKQEKARIAAEAAALPAGAVPYGAARRLGELENTRITESSGLACARQTPGAFWTHNDSGDDARLYLFDSRGADLGSCQVAGVDAYDWEDLASFRFKGRNCLLVCDTGNNSLNAAVQMIYLVEEPSRDPQTGRLPEQVRVRQTIHFSYEDDFRNCEAVAVDPTSRTILLVTKEYGPQCSVYALPWPEDNPTKAFVARKIATLHLIMATGMDISPDGRRAIVSTYRDALEYTRGEKEDWRAALARRPRRIALPKRQQGETICYGLDGKTLYLTSEKRPTPLLQVPVSE
ncbi:MAG: hypothetical protein HQ581_04050 [Planctomycetes bacterium]|nr:hypothetical protein [Planctomycetota bacterium]